MTIRFSEVFPFPIKQNGYKVKATNLSEVEKKLIVYLNKGG